MAGETMQPHIHSLLLALPFNMSPYSIYNTKYSLGPHGIHSSSITYKCACLASIAHASCEKPLSNETPQEKVIIRVEQTLSGRACIIHGTNHNIYIYMLYIYIYTYHIMHTCVHTTHPLDYHAEIMQIFNNTQHAPCSK